MATCEDCADWVVEVKTEPSVNEAIVHVERREKTEKSMVVMSDEKTEKSMVVMSDEKTAVSYTHLTLPTILLV